MSVTVPVSSCFRDVCSCLYGVNVYLHTSYFFIFIFFMALSEGQSAMKRSGSDFYIILTLYWYILWGIHHHLVEVCYFFNIVIIGLWSVIICTSLTRKWWWIFSRLCSISSYVVLVGYLSLWLHVLLLWCFDHCLHSGLCHAFVQMISISCFHLNCLILVS